MRHARTFEWIYQRLERLMIALDPLFAKIGYDRVEGPIALAERGVKGLLFDCKMCGQCVLSSTGMSCPMNCPKQLRNGPCGGVRPGNYCEVKPWMKCVWCLAWDGSTRMQGGHKISEVMPPVDRSLEGSSAWLRVSREKAAKLRESKDAAKTAIAQAFPAARMNEPSAAPLAPEPPAAVNRASRL
ncbi:MAG TPA: methylenetetrahydrofolate reductase C-terminal domain-containing protein [Thermohalobaculum sp.]|nr:methylenetetrahydrofolate reductase C-terminal domain-containing protein [Thermohalobaculum sp.]